MNIRLSIIIPAYHEGDRIAASLSKTRTWLKEHSHLDDTEVVVVAADSSDGTGKIAATSGKQFLHFQLVEPGARVGKGRDVRAGIFAANGEYRLFMDADLATPLHHLTSVYEFIETGEAMAIGVRNLQESHTGLRKFISEFGNILVQTFLTPGVKDSQCGFKVFRADVAEALFGRQYILSWGFDMEILAIARKLGYQTELIAINDWHDPKPEGLVGDSSIGVAINTGIDLFKILGNRLIGKYKQPHFPSKN